MTCDGKIIIGDTPETQINYGETIELVLTYKDEYETVVDLTGATVSVFASAPPVIKASAEVTIHDAEAGQVRFFLGRDDALSLRKGPNNWFRIQVIFGPESDDVTPEIYLQVT